MPAHLLSCLACSHRCHTAITAHAARPAPPQAPSLSHLLICAACPAAGALASLLTLLLSGNRFGACGVAALSRALTHRHLGIRHLDLSSNRLRDGGLDAIGLAARDGAMASLKELQLSECGIGDAGLAAFARSVAYRTPCAITEEGAEEGADEGAEEGVEKGSAHPLQHSWRAPMPLASLTRLELASNQIGDRGVGALTNALRGAAGAALPALTALEVGGSLSDRGLEWMAQIVQEVRVASPAPPT